MRVPSWLLVLVALLAGCATKAPTTVRPPAPGGTAGQQCAGDATLGVEVGELSRAARSRLGVPGAVTGAVVTSIYDGGPAAEAGMRVGDVITGIGGETVANDCDAIVLAYGGEPSRLSARRRGEPGGCGPVAAELWRAGGPVEVSLLPVESLPFLSSRCERGDALACFRVGWLTWSRSDAPAARATAVGFYERACRDGAGEACAYLGVALPDVGREAGQRAAFERACDLGSAAGCAHLAYFFATGTGVARDDAHATALYVKSCDLGDAKGCYNVGLMYGEGRGVPRDQVRSVEAYADACGNGSAMACTNLGWMVQAGTVGDADPQAAADLYRRGCEGTRCEGPNLLACVNLGRAYRDGIGVAPDQERAAALFERVCDGATVSGSHEPLQVTRACALLGGMHLAGSAPAADQALGRTLSERACTGGDDFGCFNAAAAHAHGLGGPVDEGKAAGFYERGCDVDDAESCYELAVRLVDGRGIAADPARARALTQKACAAGFAKACAPAPPR